MVFAPVNECQMEKYSLFLYAQWYRPGYSIFYHHILFQSIFAMLVKLQLILVLDVTYIGNKPCNILLYADDIVIVAPSWDAQQKLRNLFYDEICNISMCLNVAKSTTSIFSPCKSNRRVLLSFPEFFLCGHPIVNVNIWVTGYLLLMMTIRILRIILGFYMP